jgi:hypothetical protein
MSRQLGSNKDDNNSVGFPVAEDDQHSAAAAAEDAGNNNKLSVVLALNLYVYMRTVVFFCF